MRFYAQPIEYPYPEKFLHLFIENKSVKMAYMDVSSPRPNNQVVILFHGKNFNGFYWKSVIASLIRQGYRVIVPDQIGWGKSDKPNIHYSFYMLAQNNKILLDSLHVQKVNIIGHSMGGMLAVRFALMFPEMVDKLILENPIGLEDYRTFVPYVSIDDQYKSELSATYKSYKKYQQTYYPQWKKEYEDLVKAQAESLSDPDFKNVAWVNALTYDMIYQQPVCYEFNFLMAKTLLIIGQADRTIVGKAKVPQNIVKNFGQYPRLGRKVHSAIRGSKLVELQGVGHIPHIQEFSKFDQAVNDFLKD
jgi:pimeloyl-ACP methyl ester carboxylesterase